MSNVTKELQEICLDIRSHWESVSRQQKLIALALVVDEDFRTLSVFLNTKSNLQQKISEDVFDEEVDEEDDWEAEDEEYFEFNCHEWAIDLEVESIDKFNQALSDSSLDKDQLFKKYLKLLSSLRKVVGKEVLLMVCVTDGDLEKEMSASIKYLNNQLEYQRFNDWVQTWA
ncbi:hypothetical protein PQO03_13230 [Lentisphaera profundi]|uniref:DUF4303 domain-containing protein n=1 Tax=Lentisphaera profundi TaxID=1658616 RepID=A0ABY7W1E1_9BACT|nr:hypothetical protein [Lentisphaera profundi]WDE98799.1 hypothetical protein PQO03_13230 [Lentisphaera profundi]